MPLIQVSMIEGRSPEAKARLIRDLTEACAAAIDTPLDSIRIILTDVPGEHWGVGGVPKAGPPASNKPPLPK